jgi:signal transduction histidine kinase
MADVGGWELDVETGQLYWTEGTRLIHDVPESYEPTPEAAIEFYHPEDREAVEQAVRRCQRTGEPYDLELRLITAEGRERWVQTRGEFVTESGTETLRGTVQDITEIRENEQQLTVLNRVLRHNLRNNLNVVTANAELLREQLEQLRPAIDRCRDSATAPEELQETLAAFPFTDALDNVEQLEAKTWELLATADKSRELADIIDQIDQTDTFDIGSLLSSLVSEYETQHPDATISVESAQIATEANAESVSLAVEELLENALTHAGPEPAIDIAIDQPNESRVELTIEDDGPGIPEAERQALEEGQETPLRHSSGFGLWTASWLLSRTGGAVSIIETESGTCVRVDLPAA